MVGGRLRPLDRKLLRDLWRLRAQVLAIALVMASGVGLMCMSLTSIEALGNTAEAYYDRYRFAQVFARVERAPEHLAERIRLIPGVESVSTRVVRSAVLDLRGFEEPVIGQLVSLPPDAATALNRVALTRGRMPAAGNECVLAEPFAEAHGLVPGSTLRAIMNGHWQELTVVGLGLSPEYVYTIGPGALMPDDRRFGVIWLGEKAMQAAYDLDGAFNDVSLTLLHGASPDSVIARIDQLLARYGGVGAIARKDQISNWFLMNEIEQLKSLASILPTVFLAVAAFLTNMVLSRLIAVERSEIGLLKAFGYANSAIAWHYVKLVLGIGVVGIVIGCALGWWLGLTNTRLYAEFYRFPFLLYSPGAGPFVLASVASLAAGLLGALGTVRQAAMLPPAEAMRPPAPPLFRRTGLARWRLFRAMDQPSRILLRQIGRWPARSFTTSVGIGMAVAVLVSSMMWMDAIDRIADVYFLQAQGQDITVGFSEPRSRQVLRELARLDGVVTAEPLRVVPARLRFGPREERQPLQGVPAHQELQHVFDAAGHALDMPPGGLVISTMLAEMLAVKVGDVVSAQVLEGRRPLLQIPVVATFETYIGSPAYIDIDALNRLMREQDSVTAVQLRLDASRRLELFRRLKETPRISFITLKDAAVRTFHDTLARTLLIYVSFFVVFACTLAFGVTYNSARIALSERGRELATLRVLGFTRAEISYILLGEVGLLTFVALPLGCLMGYVIASIMVSSFTTELFRIPLAIQASTYAIAMLIGLGATLASALLVRRRVDRLDLIAVLKTRE